MLLICRTCMQINKKYVNIFDYRVNANILSEMLIKCTTLKVQKNDGLPLYMCNYCLEKLSSAWDFHKMAIETDSKLRNIFNKGVKENSMQSNNSFIDTTIVKEESTIVKNETSNSLVQGNANIINTFHTQLTKCNNVNCDLSVSSNCAQDENKKESIDEILKSIDGQNNSEKSLSELICKIDSVISEKLTEGENEDSKGNMDKVSLCPAEIKNKMPLANNAEQNILNSHDYYNVEDLVNKNIIKDYDLDNDTGNAKEIHESTMKIKPIVKEYDHINKILLKDTINSYSFEECVNINNLNEPELQSEKGDQKLTWKEKEKKSAFCKTCNRSFGYRYYFEVHVKLHNGDRQCKCNICGKTFVRQFQLRLHMAVHSDERPFSCEACGKTFKTLSALHSHKTIHTNNTSYTCSICQKSFKSKHLLRSHLQRHKNEKKYTCEVCGKSFGDANVLYKHKFTHIDEKKFACAICGKAFTTNLRMREHSKLHSEARPHSCSYCDKCFKTKDVMDAHILIHTGEKPFSCKICGKLFRQSSALYNHMRIHTGETPYVCKLCPSQFKYSHHLQNHMKIHTFT